MLSLLHERNAVSQSSTQPSRVNMLDSAFDVNFVPETDNVFSNTKAISGNIYRNDVCTEVCISGSNSSGSLAPMVSSPIVFEEQVAVSHQSLADVSHTIYRT
ncbi:hypothetical protein V6N12_034930 [Hibiscus sabdariffa]|uniref:Uncharacterized protein n=1 Tax=Hibiscus sabdariffa TaxID=183260 RepID=A0ABR2BNV5_9ROSI